MEYKHHIFLSYSRKDTERMLQVHSSLCNAGFLVWVDEILETGTPLWKDTIEEAIEQACCVVVILSPAVKDESVWVKNEIAYAKACNRRIFSLLTVGNQETSIPIELINDNFIDLQKGYEGGMQRLIKDVTKHKDKLKVAGNSVPDLAGKSSLTNPLLSNQPATSSHPSTIGSPISPPPPEIPKISMGRIGWGINMTMLLKHNSFFRVNYILFVLAVFLWIVIFPLRFMPDLVQNLGILLPLAIGLIILPIALEIPKLKNWIFGTSDNNDISIGLLKHKNTFYLLLTVNLLVISILAINLLQIYQPSLHATHNIVIYDAVPPKQELATLVAGDSLPVVGALPDYEWYWVELPNGTRGWVERTEFVTQEGNNAGITLIELTPLSTFTPTSTPSSPLFTAKIELAVYIGPGTEFGRIDSLAANASYDIYGKSVDGNWLYVLVPSGEYGWIRWSDTFGTVSGNPLDIQVIDGPTLTPEPITSTPTLTFTLIPTVTSTDTLTPTPSNTPTPSPTNTPPPTQTPTNTPTPTPFVPEGMILAQLANGKSFYIHSIAINPEQYREFAQSELYDQLEGEPSPHMIDMNAISYSEASWNAADLYCRVWLPTKLPPSSYTYRLPTQDELNAGLTSGAQTYPTQQEILILIQSNSPDAVRYEANGTVTQITVSDKGNGDYLFRCVGIT